MARLKSIAKAGYYPIPDELLPQVAAAVRFVGRTRKESLGDRFAIFDPCAGEGRAVAFLQEAWKWSFRPVATRWDRTLNNGMGGYHHDEAKEDVVDYPDVHACELEETRFKQLGETRQKGHHYQDMHIVQGDAFTLSLDTKEGACGVNVLYLNPPYDFDPEVGRLEERWLVRFSRVLAPGGVLIFVVPSHALKASAVTIGRLYNEVQVCRFPSPHHEVFKQVILYARRSPDLYEPNLREHDQVMAAYANPQSLPLLSEVVPYEVEPLPSHHGFADGLKTHIVDPVRVLAEYKPWHATVKRKGLVCMTKMRPEGRWLDLCLRTFPMACIPRPSYIAAGVATGIFNGSKVKPNDPTRFPPVYVKGTFAKVFHSIKKSYRDDGSLEQEVFVQHPRLEITVLNGRTLKYVDLKSDVAVNPTHTTLEEFTVGDLFSNYSQGMMQALRDRCPVLHDPAVESHNFPLPSFPRRLFAAQEGAVRASCKLLDRPDNAVLLLGQIGSGKSTVSLATAHTRGAKRVLIMCPPHLLKSWTDQCSYVVPWAKVMVLDSPEALRRYASDPHPEMLVGVMSREAAKLGHAFEGLALELRGAAKGTPDPEPVDPHGIVSRPLTRRISQVEATRRYKCPDCGTPITAQPEECVTKRLRCQGTRVVLKNEAARLAKRLAWMLAARFPMSGLVGQWIDAKAYNAMRAKSTKHEDKNVPIDRDSIVALVRSILAEMQRQHRKRLADSSYKLGVFTPETPLPRALWHLLAYLDNPALTMECYTVVAKNVQELATSGADIEYAVKTKMEELPLHVLTALGPKHLLDGLRKRADALLASKEGYTPPEDTDELETQRRGVLTHFQTQLYNGLVSGEGELEHYGFSRAKYKDSPARIHGQDMKDSGNLGMALSYLDRAAVVNRKHVCRSPLYQGVPRPRRYPLAKLIRRRFKRAFDFLIIDEGHEYSNQDSAQSQAAQALYSLKLPTMVLTGSIMNGYASSLFLPCWYLSAAFREAFSRDDLVPFVETYGYLKETITQRKPETNYGVVTDRQDPKETFSQAPGVMPAALLRYILPIAVTLQLEDLKIELPPMTEEVVEIEPTGLQRSNYEEAISELVDHIRHDRRDKDLRGRLFGQMAEIPSYLDRCTADTGNSPDGSYTVAYPKSVGGAVVASFAGLPASTILPKERALLRILTSEAANDRNSMVFVYHTELMPRLKRLTEAEGLKVAILDADKVPAKKREAWIEKEVVKKGVRVLLVNPVAVSTGLNNLIHFCNAIYYENPACNPITRRQSLGRVYRIGQTKPVTIYSLVYSGTGQEALHKLLLLKVGVSEAADGLDPDAALQAAGVGDIDITAGRSVGELLYSMIVDGQ